MGDEIGCGECRGYGAAAGGAFVMVGKYQAYSEYKDSGVEWLGDVPAGWNIKKLKYICDVQTGDKDTVMAIDDGDYPFFVRSQTVERINSIGADCEAVLTAGDGVGVGKVFHYYEGKFDYHQRVYMLNEFSGVLGRFVFYYLSNNFYKVALEGNAKSTVDSLRLPQFLNFEFSLPELNVQQKIASFLDHETAKIDTLIEKQQQLIKLLKEKRLTMIDFAKEGAEYVRLENCSKIMAREIEYSDDDFYIPIGLFNRGRGLFHKDVTLGKDLGDSDFYYIESKDLIFSGQFAWEGAVALADEEDHGCIVSHRYPVVKGVDGILDTTYLWAFFTSQRGDFLMNECSRGAAGRNRPLNISYLMKEKIPVPSMSEQLAISRLVWHEREIEEKIKKVIATLNEKRTSLISAAVTGKIDVRHFTLENKREGSND